MRRCAGGAPSSCTSPPRRRAWPARWRCATTGARGRCWASASWPTRAARWPGCGPTARRAHRRRSATGGCLPFYAAAYPAVLLLLRARLRPFVPAFCLDGLLGGLTLAAGCAVLVPPHLAGASTAKTVAGLAFPCADLVLVAIAMWACAMTGWRGGTFRWLALGLAIAAAGDIVLDLQIVHGAYDPMALSNAAFPAAMVAIGVAAWREVPGTRALRTDTMAMLGMPSACAL